MNLIYDVVIIGSGPAGMAAGIYAKRAGLAVVILEKTGISGGQVLSTYEVDNYPGLPMSNGFDLSEKFREHAEHLGVEIKAAAVERIEDRGETKLLYTEDETYETRTVILATGAEHAKLGVPGEEELTGMGVSYCATCDGAFFRGRTVAVIGGGDVAVEDAIFLARGCEKVYLIHRREELRAAKILQDALMKLPNVEILWNCELKEIQGEDQVENLLIYNNKTQQTNPLAVSGVFIAVGNVPNTDLVKGLVDMDEKGYIIADETCATSVPGIFAAGDVRTKQLRQIITAAADGANAVTSVEQFMLK
ncbi:MAG: thioredoxin-disulfide reductase [Lachnospiraceae bacterium]|nr:thioredoxin-disulfide reductase [Lachnospiraceae bacterium]